MPPAGAGGDAPRAIEGGWKVDSVDSIPVEIIAFYYPGRPTAADERCQAAFLGNFYPSRLQLCRDDATAVSFQNAQAAFQALKFWNRKDMFQTLSAKEAFRLSRTLPEPDWTYAGYGSNWKAMYDVLLKKFEDPELQTKLLSTGDALLLEHNEKCGRDSVWSNNHDGSGMNWLGLQLMLLRDSIRKDGPGPWRKWLEQHVNLETGTCVDTAWPDLVQRATVVTLESL
eukprot:Skav214547  [mRNA]  locus=scaffold410:728630:729310:+ [translate_table: standard]